MPAEGVDLHEVTRRCDEQVRRQAELSSPFDIAREPIIFRVDAGAFAHPVMQRALTHDQPAPCSA